VGASFSPVADLVTFSAPRPACPGHKAIRIYEDNANVPVFTGTCEIRGTAGADVIDGTGSQGDVILAGAGNDRIHANDRHIDRVDCGRGRDTVWADRTDKLSGCETVHR
jgi:Ca2+-binding RTX toxin-like protein